jgi:hypothetical protein
MPPKLPELKAKFAKAGKRKIFGDHANSEIDISLHRLANKPPSKKTIDLAKRILSVIEGHGTDADILNFKNLIREFQTESQIRIGDFFSFLKYSRTSITAGHNALKVAKLDKNVLQYSEFLDWINALAETIEIKPNGQVIKTPGIIKPKNRELLNRFLELKTKEEAKAKNWFKKYVGPEESKLILGHEIVFGTVILVVNSKLDVPNFISFGNERGYFKSGNKHHPAIIAIDINPAKRTDGINVKTSLVHELRHGLFEMFRRLMISDPHNPIASATLNLTSPELNVAARSRRELILHDREIYEILLERQLSPEDIENITKQRAYLDELHSSIMQRKPSWFMWNKEVYSTEVSKGKHSEMVGNNPKDIAANQDLFCHIQGVYMLDMLVNAAKDPNNPWSKVIGPNFRTQIPKYFNRVGSIIATSLTIQQASRLISQLWKNILTEFPNINLQVIFSQMNPTQKGRPSNGQTIEQFLAS